MKKIIFKYIYITAVLSLSFFILAILSGPNILKAYIQTGIGNCRTIPLLCIIPEEERVSPEIDKDYVQGLLPYTFRARLLPYPLPELGVSVPKGFAVVRGEVTKVYYKRKKFDAKSPAIYLLYQKPEFFANLYPRLKKEGITNNYQFVSRTMYATFEGINNITDVFFVIMKSVFTPNLGEQKNVKIVKFRSQGRRGFIAYNLAPLENYFDCDIINNDDSFVKIYIKDNGARLDLEKVIAIISTLNYSDTDISTS